MGSGVSSHGGPHRMVTITSINAFQNEEDGKITMTSSCGQHEMSETESNLDGNSSNNFHGIRPIIIGHFAVERKESDDEIEKKNGSSSSSSAAAAAADAQQLFKGIKHVRFASVITINHCDGSPNIAKKETLPKEDNQSTIYGLQTNVLKIYMENGQTKSFLYDRQKTTVADIMIQVMEKMDLSCHHFLSLALTNRSHDMQIQSSIRLLNPEDSIYQTVSVKLRQDDLRCCLRVAFVPTDINELLAQDPVAYNYLYAQVCNDIIEERYARELKCNDVIQFSAMNIWQCVLDNRIKAKNTVKYIEHQWGLQTFVPRSLLQSMGLKQIRKQINHYLRIYQEIYNTSFSVKREYLRRIEELKSFGGQFFHMDKPGEKIYVGPRSGIDYVTDLKVSCLSTFSQLISLTIERNSRLDSPIFTKVDLEVMTLQETTRCLSIRLLSNSVDDFISWVSGYYALQRNKKLPVKFTNNVLHKLNDSLGNDELWEDDEEDDDSIDFESDSSQEEDLNKIEIHSFPSFNDVHDNQDQDSGNQSFSSLAPVTTGEVVMNNLMPIDLSYNLMVLDDSTFHDFPADPSEQSIYSTCNTDIVDLDNAFDTVDRSIVSDTLGEFQGIDTSNILLSDNEISGSIVYDMHEGDVVKFLDDKDTLVEQLRQQSKSVRNEMLSCCFQDPSNDSDAYFEERNPLLERYDSENLLPPPDDFETENFLNEFDELECKDFSFIHPPQDYSSSLEIILPSPPEFWCDNYYSPPLPPPPSPPSIFTFPNPFDSLSLSDVELNTKLVTDKVLICSESDFNRDHSSSLLQLLDSYSERQSTMVSGELLLIDRDRDRDEMIIVPAQNPEDKETASAKIFTGLDKL